MKNIVLSVLILSFVIILCKAAAWADTVYLKNGGKINGTVVDDRRSSVVVDIGNGTVTHNKDEIVKIEKNNKRARIYAPAAKNDLSEVFNDMAGAVNSVITLDFLKRSGGRKE